MDAISNERYNAPINITTSEATVPAIVHLLPCDISKSGPAPVAQYFKVASSSETDPSSGKI